jgi:hypothetical protein
MGDKLAVVLAEENDMSRQYINSEVLKGTFKSAKKVNPAASKSPWLIDEDEFNEWLTKKRWIHADPPKP